MKGVLNRALFGGVIWFLVIGISTSATAGSSECTRENLKSITDKYFAALEAHNPSDVPFAKNVRYTENGIDVPVGKGIWETAVKITFKRSMADMKKCGTHSQAVMEEIAMPSVWV